MRLSTLERVLKRKWGSICACRSLGGLQGLLFARKTRDPLLLDQRPVRLQQGLGVEEIGYHATDGEEENDRLEDILAPVLREGDREDLLEG